MANKKTEVQKGKANSTELISRETAKEIVEQKNKKYRNSPVIGDGGDLFKDEEDRRAYTKKTLSSILKNWNMPTVQNDEEAIERLESYFYKCAEEGKKPTVEEMALSLGMTRQRLWEIETGRSKLLTADIIKKAKEVLAAFDAAAAMDGKTNMIGYIFRGKNYYGMKDQQDIVVAPSQPYGSDLSTEELEKKYSDSVVDTTATEVSS